MGLGLPILLFVGGLVILLWLFLWSRQRQALGRIPETDAATPDSALLNTDDAVLVATERGQLIHVNDTLRRWLALEGSTPTLETIAAYANPPESLLELLAGQGQSSFQLATRWIQATSYTIPVDNETRVVVMMRELTTASASAEGGYEMGKAILIVNEIGEKVNASLGMEISLQAMLSIVQLQLAADAGEITLWDETNKMLIPRGWVGDVPYVLALAEAGGAYSINEGISGWIARQRKPVLVADKADPTAVRPKLVDSAYSSFIGVPLILNDRFIGTFELASIAAKRFSALDLSLLQAVAKPIAIVIYNAELYNDQTKRIEDVTRLQQIAGSDARGAYSAITEQIARLIGAELCGILVYDTRKELLVAQAPFFGLPEFIRQNYMIPVPPDSEGRDIWERDDAWISDDLADEQLADVLGMRLLVDAAGVYNTMLMPLIAGGRRIGAIQLANKRAFGGFGLRDEQTVRLLASQAAVAVENIRLKDAESVRDTELESLQEITLSLGSLSQSDDFFEQANEKIAQLMNIESCGILLYDAVGAQLVAQLPFYGVTSDALRGYVIPLQADSPFAQIWEQEDYFYLNNVNTNALANSAGLDEIARAIGTSNMLFAALNSGGRRIGAIQASNKRDGELFNEKDGRLLLIFAAQLASVLENSRLFREAQRRANEADRLRRVAELASSIVTPDDSFQPVLREIAAILDSPIAYVNTFDQQSARLVTEPLKIFGIELVEPVIMDTYSAGFEHSVAVSRRPFLSNDLQTDKRVLPVYKDIVLRLNLRQVVQVALVVGDQSLGELGIANRDDDYVPSDIRLAQSMAIHIAAALDRVRLYESTGQNLRRRLMELDAIQRVSSELALTLDLDRVMDVIRVEAVQATEADGNTVALLKPSAEWTNPIQPHLERRLGERRAFADFAPIELEALQRPNEVIVIDDYFGTSGLLKAERIKPMPPQARSAMAVAFTYEDEVVGIIHLYHSQPRQFDNRAAAFLETLAAKASLSVGNNHRYLENQDRSERLRRRVDQLNSIFELSQLGQTMADPVMLLEAIAYSVQKSCGYDVVLMTLVDEANNAIRRVAQAGVPLMQFEQSRNKIMPLTNVRELFEKHEYQISESYFYPFEQVTQWAVEYADVLSTGFSGIRTLYPSNKTDWRDGDMLLVPITGATGDLLGVMSLDRPFEGKRPDRSVIEILEIFAHQAANTIENTRLYLRTMRDAEQEARLNEVMEAITSTLEMNAILGAVARGALRLIPFNRMTMALLDSDGQGFDILNANVTHDGEIVTGHDRRSTLAHTGLGYTFETGEDQLITTLETANAYDDLRSWWAEGEQIGLLIPLVTGGFTLGALHIGADHADADAFEEYRALLKRIANLAAVAIQNARLFNQAVSLRAFNESVVQSIQQGIVVLDSSGRILTINDYMRRNYGWGDDAIRQDLFSYRPEYRMALMDALRNVIETGAPRELVDQQIVFTDFTRVQNFYLYPLRAVDNVRGVVLLIDDVTERERLESALASRVEQLAALTEVSSRITAALQRTDVIKLAMDEMARVIGYDTLSLWRRDGDQLVLEAWQGYEPADTNVRIIIQDNERACWVIERQQAVSISQFLGRDPLPGETDAQSWLGIPLMQQENVFGIIALSKREPRYYNAQSEQAALTFANQVAVALTNADLFENQRSTTERLSLLNRASMRLAQSLDTENILEVALSEICTVLRVEKARAYLFERDTKMGRVIVEFPRGDFPPQLILELDSVAAIRQIVRTGQSILVENVKALAPDDVLYKDLGLTRMSAYALIPMTVAGQVTGAFELEFYKDVDTSTVRFQPEQLDPSLIIAGQAAIAVMNANLLEQTMVRTRELETLLEAAQATAQTLDLDEVFQRVVELTLHALDMDDCTLMMYDNVEDMLRVELNVNRSGDDRNTLTRGTLYDAMLYPTKMRAIRDRQVVVVRLDDPDINPNERRDMEAQGDLARMLVPLTTTSSSDAIGLLQIDLHDQMRIFNHREIRMAGALGAQAATRIENARLTTETAAQVEQGIVINDLSRAISSTMDIDGMIRTIREQVPSLVSAESMYVALYDPETTEITFPISVMNGQDQQRGSLRLGDDEVSYVIRTRRPLSLGGDNPNIDEVRRNLRILSGDTTINRYLGVPIMAGDQVLGVLAVSDREITRPFGLNVQRVLTTISAQVGAAIQNVRLFSRVQRFADELEGRVEERTTELATERDRLNALYRITAELGTTLEMESVLNRALTMVADTIAADDGAVLLLDPVTDRLYSRAALHTVSDDNENINGDMRRTREIRLGGTGRDKEARVAHPAETFADWLVNNGDNVLVDDLHTQPYWDSTAPGAAVWRSAIGVVLRNSDAVQGVMAFLGREPGMFSEPQLRLVSAASNQVSAAINNADLYNLLRDQTGRMANLLRLEREEAEKNSAILEGIADGVLLADASGVIVLFNGAAERILGIPTLNALNQSLAYLDTIYGAGQPWMSLLNDWIVRSRQARRESLLLERIEVGTKIISITASPVYNADVFLGTVSVFRDVTKDVEVDRMKSEFISNVSHELRTPMTSIKGYADLLMMGAAGSVTEQQRTFLETIKSNAERLSNLVNDLLNISKLDSGSEKLKPEDFELIDVIDGIVVNMQGRAENERKHIAVTTQVSPGLPPLYGDRAKISQILTNLVDNSFNYTYPGGKIEISARVADDPLYALISIKDNGIGIPTEFQPRIWNRFERYDEHALVMEVAGTGLGLSIVKNLVEMHRGDVWVESEPNVGSTFYVKLPIAGIDSVTADNDQAVARESGD